MRRRLSLAGLSLVALTVFAGPASAESGTVSVPLPAPADCGTDTALTFVRKHLHPASHMGSMMIRIASLTPNYKEALAKAKEEGFEEEASKHFIGALRESVQRHLPIWECNLSETYATFLTDAQLASIMESGDSSPEFEKMTAAMGKIDEKMKTLSEDMMKAALADFINDAYTFAMEYKKP
ncbi:hypothetical protein HH303_00210 [Rhodospirillaceae bacterium KN72]|uniref:DUF2059 domain-containing protein n=1 Tax=Pacificispira spongiicola TaxID=2729598 RepID=A0A7Y0DWG5_9PROT|nr:hypothetical protein [Pacificispira spongiicola]NMM42880.1 hypothetical protein [Pacificispira spongiicola]